MFNEKGSTIPMGVILLGVILIIFLVIWKLVVSPVSSQKTPVKLTESKSAAPISYQTKSLGQYTCSSGFLFYDNEYFSVCVPENMRIEEELINTTYAKLKFRSEVYKLNISTLAITDIADRCSLKTEVTLSGYKAVRYTQKSYNNSDINKLECGEKIYGYNTAFSHTKDKLSGAFLMWYSGENPSISDYQSVEQSLRIKKL